jgi:hypothetical protein
MSGHTPTPGPWRYQDGADAYTLIVRGARAAIAKAVQS